MKVVKTDFQILPRDELRGGLSIIERAGRLCYKSEDKITNDSADAFVHGLIKRKHLSVLEHGDMIFEIDDRHIYENVAESLQILRDSGRDAPMLAMSRIGGRYIVSGNMRAWIEMFGLASLAGRYFIGHFDPVFIEDNGFYDEDAAPDPRVRQIRYADLHDPQEKRAHMRQTVRFIIDRGVSHEFVRHRKMSISQESTRYCNYVEERFNHEITVIKPWYLDEDTESYALWKRQCMSAEVAYFSLLNFGLMAQEARAVLPHSTKTELMMTGTLEQWDHFFNLRARQITGAAHPQAAEVAIPLYMQFKAILPEVFT